MKKIKFDFRTLVQLMTSSVLGLVISAMIVSGTFSLKCFYDVGDIYEFTYSIRDVSGVNMVYDITDNIFRVNDDYAYKWFWLEGENAEKWNTLLVELEELDAAELNCLLEFYNGKQEPVLVGQQEVVLSEGRNIVDLTDVGKFSGILVIIEKQNGISFIWNKVQLYEQTPPAYEDYLMGVALVCGMISFIFFKLFDKKLIPILNKRIPKNMFRRYLNAVQQIMIQFAEMFPIFTVHCNKFVVRIFRRLILVGMFYYMTIVTNMGVYAKKQYFHRHMLVVAVLFVIIALTCREKERLERLQSNNRFFSIWICMWVFTCISDFFVEKRYSGWGMIMLFTVGFFFLQWRNMAHPEELLEDIVKAVKYFSISHIIICWFTRPVISGARYAGIAWNPNIYAQYLVPMAAVCFGEIDQWMLKKKKHILLETVMLIICYHMAVLSGSRTALVALAMIALGFISKWIYNKCHMNLERKTSVIFIALFLICIAPVLTLNTWCLSNIVLNLNSQVIYPADSIQIELIQSDMAFFSETVYGASTLQQAIQRFSWRGSFEKFTSGRLSYWTAYLRNMNLFGHEYHLSIWGNYRQAHCGLLEIAYRYGVFAVIPYILLLAGSIYLSWKYMRNELKQGKYASFPFFLIIGVVCIIMVENVERPFYSVSNIVLYMVIGLFINGEGECRKID